MANNGFHVAQRISRTYSSCTTETLCVQQWGIFFFYKVSLLENVICIRNKHTRSKTLSMIFEFSLFLILLSNACLVLFLNLPQNITSSGLLMLVFQLKSSLGVLWQTASTLTSLPTEDSCPIHTLHWASFL